MRIFLINSLSIETSKKKGKLIKWAKITEAAKNPVIEAKFLVF
jgi:hypothetical protein